MPRCWGSPEALRLRRSAKLAANDDDEDDEDEKLSKWPPRCTEELESLVCLTLLEGESHGQQSRGKSGKLLWCPDESRIVGAGLAQVHQRWRIVEAR